MLVKMKTYLLLATKKVHKLINLTKKYFGYSKENIWYYVFYYYYFNIAQTLSEKVVWKNKQRKSIKILVTEDIENI